MSCLYCAVSNATASSLLGISSAVSPKCTGTAQNSSTPKTGDDEGNADNYAISVVEKALEIFSLVSGIIKTSTGAGSQILQDHLLIGVWVLITGLQAQLSTSSFLAADKGKEEKGKSPSKAREGSSQVNLMKVQQGFGVFSVALASQALSMMSALFDDLRVECVSEGDSKTCSESEVEAAEVQILGQYTAVRLAAKCFAAAPLNQLLFYLVTISYRKACTLKCIQKHASEGDTFSTSDSTRCYEDDFSCSDESSGDDDDDSEPILGLWFEETIAPPETPLANQISQSANDSDDNAAKNNVEKSGSIVPEKGEPNGHSASHSGSHHSPKANDKMPSPQKSREGSRSATCSQSVLRSSHHRGRSYSRLRSHSKKRMSYRGRYRSRSRSRSPRRYKSRYSHSRSRSYSPRGKYGYSDRRKEFYRSHSQSPMSSRKRHVASREILQAIKLENLWTALKMK